LPLVIVGELRMASRPGMTLALMARLNGDGQDVRHGYFLRREHTAYGKREI